MPKFLRLNFSSKCLGPLTCIGKNFTRKQSPLVLFLLLNFKMPKEIVLTSKMACKALVYWLKYTTGFGVWVGLNGQSVSGSFCGLADKNRDWQFCFESPCYWQLSWHKRFFIPIQLDRSNESKLAAIFCELLFRVSGFSISGLKSIF